MFSKGDRVLLAAGPEFSDVAEPGVTQGTVVRVGNDPWPYEVHWDVTKQEYTEFFDEEELTHA